MKQAAKQPTWIHPLLIITLVAMALPVALELFVLLPLLMFRAVGGDIFWALSTTISVSAIVGLMLGLVSSIAAFAFRSQITNKSTRELGRWITGLLTVYVLAFLLIAFVFLGSR